MEATYSFSGSRSDLSTAMQKANNIDFNIFGGNYMFDRGADSYIYIYNVSDTTYTVQRPPMIRELKLVGRKDPQHKFDPKTRAILCTRLPQPLLIPKGNVESNEVDIIPFDTRRFAMDIINPDNHGINQEAYLEPKQTTSMGVDLGARGVFYSENGPGASKKGFLEAPTDKEITDAEVRLDAFYRGLMNKADTVEATAPQELNALIGPEFHAAAEYLGEDRKWHGKRAKTDICETCGERTTKGAAFHKTEDNTICVSNWAKAVKAGAVTRAQAYDATDLPEFAPRTPIVPVVPVAPKATTPTKENKIPTE